MYTQWTSAALLTFFGHKCNCYNQALAAGFTCCQPWSAKHLRYPAMRSASCGCALEDGPLQGKMISVPHSSVWSLCSEPSLGPKGTRIPPLPCLQVQRLDPMDEEESCGQGRCILKTLGTCRMCDLGLLKQGCSSGACADGSCQKAAGCGDRKSCEGGNCGLPCSKPGCEEREASSSEGLDRDFLRHDCLRKPRKKISLLENVATTKQKAAHVIPALASEPSLEPGENAKSFEPQAVSS